MTPFIGNSLWQPPAFVVKIKDSQQQEFCVKATEIIREAVTRKSFHSLASAWAIIQVMPSRECDEVLLKLFVELAAQPMLANDQLSQLKLAELMNELSKHGKIDLPLSEVPGPYRPFANLGFRIYAHILRCQADAEIDTGDVARWKFISLCSFAALLLQSGALDRPDVAIFCMMRTAEQALPTD